VDNKNGTNAPTRGKRTGNYYVGLLERRIKQSFLPSLGVTGEFTQLQAIGWLLA
jgi:hypothetical protein